VAVSSHTGTLVDQAAMATAMFKKAGVVEFHDSAEMIKTAVAMSLQPIPRAAISASSPIPVDRGSRRWIQAVDDGLVLSTWSEAGRNGSRRACTRGQSR